MQVRITITATDVLTGNPINPIERVVEVPDEATVPLAIASILMQIGQSGLVRREDSGLSWSLVPASQLRDIRASRSVIDLADSFEQMLVNRGVISE